MIYFYFSFVGVATLWFCRKEAAPELPSGAAGCLSGSQYLSAEALNRRLLNRSCGSILCGSISGSQEEKELQKLCK